MAAAHRCMQSGAEDGGDGLPLIRAPQAAASVNCCNINAVQYSETLLIETMEVRDRRNREKKQLRPNTKGER